ncbi:UNVERIFIED_CONTAM: hypothetical protein PYX00_009215 [Menopon gallinae]|uniref:G-protein coupled receptors family 1 profile domain-containing protein n=1 Tax=Menopon gallinae TaxID=328185 RepID=A0AAW2HAE5_9NEOP
MIKEKNLRTPFNTILLNLVCSDLSVSILGNPITFTAALYRKWIFGRTVCVFYGFFMALMGITSITTITVLSYERYLIITKPFSLKMMNNGHSKWVICGIWTYSFTLTFPPLIGWGDYVNESANISCSVNWENQDLWTTLYIIYLFVLGLALPVFIICFSYVKIVLLLTQKRIPNSRVNKVDVRVSVMLAVMVIVFLLAWTPYAVLALMVAFVDPNIVSPAVSVIPALLAKSSICYNPIIYAGMNTQVNRMGVK